MSADSIERQLETDAMRNRGTAPPALTDSTDPSSPNYDPYNFAGSVIIQITTADGQTLNKSRKWVDYYNNTWKNTNGFNTKDLIKYVDYQELNNFELNAGQITNFMWANGIDPNAISSKTRTGGSGKSFEQRQNDINSILLEITNQATIAGIPKNKEAFLYIAKVAEKQSWSTAQLTKAVIDLADWKTLEQGTLLQSVDQFQQQGRNYFVNVDRKTARDWADKIASGSMSAESVEKLLQQQSKLANPWLADTIDQGINPSDLLSSSRSAIAKSLGIQVGEIDFTDSRWMNMVTKTDDKGVITLADQNTLRQNVRKDDMWSESEEAQNEANNMVGLISRIFGRSAY